MSLQCNGYVSPDMLKMKVVQFWHLTTQMYLTYWSEPICKGGE